MQIGGIDHYRMFQVGRNPAANWMQGKSQHHLKVQDMFGAQCKVTISREGKKLSKESIQETPKNSMAASAGRLLMREQQQAETDKKESSNMLDEISVLMDEIRNSYASGEDKETIAKKQDALQRLLDLKARQDQENKQRAEDAAGSAAAASKEQNEIDQKNADLYLLLKSLEEKEDEASGSSSDAKESETEDTEYKSGGIGAEISQSAAMLGASAAKRELQAKGTIDELRSDGYNKIAKANEMMREIQAELDLAKEAAGKEGLRAEERQELVSGHMETAKGMLLSNYDEIMHLRSSGIQETKDARELDLKHIQTSPLDGVKQAKQTILQTGVDAAQNEVAQNTLDKASNELEQRVQEAIDKRNEAPAAPEDVEEAEKEKAEETEEEKLEQEQLEQKRQERENNKNMFFAN